jgi:hypothetical protein
MLNRNLILPNILLNKTNVIHLSLLKVEKHLPDNPKCLAYLFGETHPILSKFSVFKKE